MAPFPAIFPAALFLAAQAALLPASTRVPEGDQGRAAAVAGMVGDVISYTRWPAPQSPPAPMRICVVGNPRHAGQLQRIALPNGQDVRVEEAAGGPAIAEGRCDTFYIGGLDGAQVRLVIAAARGVAVLTIVEDDDRCRSGAMICLHVGPGAVRFEINVDAVARGNVRIDPRVLHLSRGREEGE
jgi:hypothetical protein